MAGQAFQTSRAIVIARSRPGGSRSGFTLIELLVVIAIIALLVSILVPSLSRAKEQARAAICISNMKQIYAAMNLYASDNVGWLPQCYGDIRDAQGRHTLVSWTQVLTRFSDEDLANPNNPDVVYYQPETSYIEDKGVYQCPSADTEEEIAKVLVEGYRGTIYGFTEWDYSIWGCYGLNRRASSWSMWINLWNTKHPDVMYLLADCHCSGFDHVDEWDHWYMLRHGYRDRIHLMFVNGTVQPWAAEDIVMSHMVTPYGVSLPWWDGDEIAY